MLASLVPQPFRAMVKLLKEFNRRDYFKSVMTRSPGTLPWLTYPAIDFLSQFDLKGKTVFEWGPGGSTYWFRDRGAVVTAWEHDPKYGGPWDIVPPEDYVNGPLSTDPFDIVLIDGIARRKCVDVVGVITSYQSLVIFDNSDLYPEATEALRKKYSNQVDFFGHGPVLNTPWVTSMFWDSLKAFKTKCINQPRRNDDI